MEESLTESSARIIALMVDISTLEDVKTCDVYDLSVAEITDGLKSAVLVTQILADLLDSGT